MDFTEAQARRIPLADLPPRLKTVWWRREEQRALVDLDDAQRYPSEFSHMAPQAEVDRDVARAERLKLVEDRRRFRPLPL